MRFISHFTNAKLNKKIVITIFFAITLFSILMFSFFGSFKYRESRISPHDYPESEWICSNPTIYLKVEENREIKGYIIVDDRIINITCSIDWGHFVSIYKSSDSHNGIDLADRLIEGECECTEEQMVIIVKDDYIFSNKYASLILIRSKSANILNE